ncbi:hypothetical protein GNZ12_38675 [Paraburkholderia sp. 1N]|uniref:S-adenosylmethionine:tRNA ribosyltransferase-isomerase n=1 Tax=Paraburkholderia solitsugae TaxID=2675748 RepID=A0ABX2C2A1_9BURK|nr:S-adenosylmethionine:tRNA ribosyltransferase-isomerase [Paraburkholderia solitsugae]NPT47119.1 hypothetical protein [Paraburkholderia solitsugae]
MFTLSDFDFDLPPELIAQVALPERSASRLLEVANTADAADAARLIDRRFAELPECIAAGDLLVFNDTKVLKARFLGQKASGGKIEVPVERLSGERATLTLHVGAGTFQPVRVENLAEHKMHSEWYHLPQSLADKIAATRARGNRVIAVGTTSMRALEAAARDADTAGRPLGAASTETDIFITPGYKFRVVDRLVTNFHLPKSTLLMLVSAFAGVETIRKAYRHAIEQRYRFFSYGDAMLLTRRDG